MTLLTEVFSLSCGLAWKNSRCGKWYQLDRKSDYSDIDYPLLKNCHSNYKITILLAYVSKNSELCLDLKLSSRDSPDARNPPVISAKAIRANW